MTRTVVVPVAAAMLADVDGYFDRLKDYRDGNIDSLVSYVAEATLWPQRRRPGSLRDGSPR